MEARGARGTGNWIVDRVGALTGSGQKSGLAVGRVGSKIRVGALTGSDQNGSGFDRVGSKTGRVLTGHDDVTMMSAPDN